MLLTGASCSILPLLNISACSTNKFDVAPDLGGTSSLAIRRAGRIQPSTIAAVVGAALGIAIFVAATRSTPKSLVNAFGFAIVGGLIGRRIVIASQEYVDYKFELANRKLDRTSELVRLDAESDALHFLNLEAEIVELRTLLASYRSAGRKSLAESRQIALALRGEVATLREEQSRSRNSVPFFSTVERQVSRKSFGSGTSTAIAKSAKTATSYAHNCEQLELDIFKVL